MAKQTAPHWCPHAVSTKLGWQDPVTGEVLVCDNSLDLSTPKVKTPKVKKPVVDVEVED
jgi:hypothetical protein